MWVIYAFLSAIFAALVAIFGKLGLKDIDSTLATTIRAIIMAMFLVALSLGLKKFNGFSLSAWGSREWAYIILAGIAGALSWLFYFLALKIGIVTYVAAIDRLSLVFIFILAFMFLGEALNTRSIIGVIIMLIGAIFICVK